METKNGNPQWENSENLLLKQIAELKKKKITLSVTLFFYLNEIRQWENLENLLLKQITKLLKKKTYRLLPDCAI